MTGAVVVDIPLRWSDMDAQGHVNNVRISELVQESRHQAFYTSGAQEMLDTGIVVVTQDVEFLAPFAVDKSPLRVEVGCSQLGASRTVLDYRAWHHDLEVARARGTICPFDFDTGRPRRLTDGERSAFQAMKVEQTPWKPITIVDVCGVGDIVEVPIRWSDVDRQGHVNNVSMAGYLQEARILATTSWSPGMRRAGDHLWVVVRQDIRYRRQILPSQRSCTVHTALTRLGTSSMTLAGSIATDEGSALDAATVLVCVDPETGASVPIDDRTRDALTAHLITV
ncbi:thioesterase family protein [Cutibacterium equinum]|uniref:Thioesterase family protein n=1 Tax=Cutibacterium equinum TaxID=3016342 RepID=A0ABY7QWA9_9ACTN|nr:thioesterase family protein [Cutibacterium equinum]WCC79346.1 thioesterase family protein [Cutibacterium equinum]